MANHGSLVCMCIYTHIHKHTHLQYIYSFARLPFQELYLNWHCNCISKMEENAPNGNDRTEYFLLSETMSSRTGVMCSIRFQAQAPGSGNTPLLFYQPECLFRNPVGFPSPGRGMGTSREIQILVRFGFFRKLRVVTHFIWMLKVQQ